MRTATLLTFLLGLGLLAARLDAAVVLFLSTGNSTLDTQAKGVLENGGHTVIIGSQYTAFSASELSGVNAVLLFPNSNWSAGDMPGAAQTALVNFVNGGGGLITAEWTNWKVGAGSFATLSSVLPVVATTQYTGGAAITYTSVTPNAVLNAGVAGSFTFTSDDFAGVESYFSAKSGATVYYSSTGGAGGAGIVGWSAGLGRVLQISTTAGPNELGNTNYAALLNNAVTWVAVPEPSTYALLLSGLVALVWLNRRRAA